MRRSGVQIPEAAPRKHVANKRVLRDSTEKADPLEADLPQICHRLISVADRFCCLGGPFACLLPGRLRVLSGCRPVLIRDLSVLMLRFCVLSTRADETGPDLRRENSLPRLAPRAPFLPVDSSPCRLRNPVRAPRSFLVGIQPRQSVDRRDLSSGESHQSIRECRRSRCDTCEESRIRRRHLPGDAVAPVP